MSEPGAGSLLIGVTDLTGAIDLTNVNAVGFFGDHIRSVYMVSWRLTLGEVATPYQLWTDSYGIYNDDAAATNDYDLDGVDNLYEWGAVGDPTNSASLGRSPR